MNWRDLLRGMRRFAWAGVLLWLVVAVGSAVAYVQTPAQYVATQGIEVTLVPIGGLTAADRQRLDSQAVTLARTITSPDFLSSRQFADAVVQQQSMQSGSATSTTFSSEQVSNAITATHIDARIILTARAGSSSQAVILAQVATQTLTQHAADLLPPAGETTIRLIPDQLAPQVARDSDNAARNLLFARLGLATATALLLVLALRWIASRRTPSNVIAPTTTRQGDEDVSARQ